MRKNMVRIFALILVLAMAVGFLAMIPAQATDSNAVQIVFNNVEYGEKLSLMYAVYGEEVNYETDVAVTLYTDAACTQKWCDATYSYTATEGKVANCGIFIAEKGVPAQAIDTVLYAKATMGENSSLVQRYSVLEYLHKRLSVDAGTISAEQKTMYETLLNFAAAAQPVIYKTDPYTPINNYTYVHVDNGTYKGYATGMYLQGGTIALSDLAADGTVLSWNYQIVGGESGELTDTLTIGAQDIILTATKIDESTDPTEPVDPENANRYYIATNRSTGNYFYMTSNLGTGSTKRYTAVDSGLTELPTAITAPEAGYVFVLEENGDGTYSIYAEGVEGNNYLGWTSGNSGTLVEKSSAKILTVDKIEGGLYNIHFTNDSEERYLSLNGTINNNYFAWYAGTQRQNLVLIPVVSEGGEVPTEPTEPEVTEPEVTEPEVTEPEETNTEEATISFADKANRVSQDASQQIWAQNAITVTNNKAASTTAVADYANPARFYKGSELIIASKDMTKILVVCNNANYATALAGSTFEDGVTATAEESNVTIDFSGKKDSVTIQLTAGQVQVKSITVTRVACPHTNKVNVEAKAATCTETGVQEGSVYCNDCNVYTNGGIIPMIDHSYKAEVTTPATCTDAGEKTFTCSSCGDSYTETINATGHNYENGECTECGAEDPAQSGGPTLAATFALGANGTATHADGSSKTSYSETNNGYTLSVTNGTNFYTGARDAKGNSCFKFGASSKVGSMKFTVADDVTKVVIYVAGYKAKTVTVKINGTSYPITTTSDNGAYTAIEIDTTTTKTITFETSTGYRAMLNTIEFWKG